MRDKSRDWSVLIKFVDTVCLVITDVNHCKATMSNRSNIWLSMNEQGRWDKVYLPKYWSYNEQ